MRCSHTGEERERGKPPLFTRLLRNSGNKVLQGSTPTITATSVFYLLSSRFISPLVSFWHLPLPNILPCQPVLAISSFFFLSWAPKVEEWRFSLPSSPMLLHQPLVQKSKSQGMSSVREDVTSRFSHVMLSSAYTSIPTKQLSDIFPTWWEFIFSK